nr:MAG TPA: hypothetical protein [Caudoviricetes sp.]
MSYGIKPQQRIVTVTLQEFTINEYGEKVDLIHPYQVKVVVMEDDFTKLSHINIEEEIKIKACDCLGLIHNAITSGEIEL